VRKTQIRGDQKGTRKKIMTATESGGVLKMTNARGVCRTTGEDHDIIEEDAMLQKKGGITIVRNIIGEPRKARMKTATINVMRDDVTKMTTMRDIETRDVDNTKMRVRQNIKDVGVTMKNVRKKSTDRDIHDVITTGRTATQVEHQTLKATKSIAGESHDTQIKRIATNTDTNPRNSGPQKSDRTERQEVSHSTGKFLPMM
jgi:hypothetical protein